MSIDKARKILMSYSEKPKGCCFKKNGIELQYDLQIIIPAYNAEKYIEQCVQSLLTQKVEFHIIISIVNDGSLDKTEAVIERLVNQYTGNMVLEIISQENKGHSGARNTALDTIKGQYVMFVDSDDLVPDGALNRMLEEAYRFDADVLQGSWYIFDDKKSVEHILAKEGKDSAKETFSGYPWGKLYKYSVIQNFHFPEGYWFEDTPISFILKNKDLNYVSIKDVVYGYRQNIEGITVNAVGKKKGLDSYWITELCLSEFQKFKVPYNQQAYEYLLNQIIMNEYRISKGPWKICILLLMSMTYIIVPVMSRIGLSRYVGYINGHISFSINQVIYQVPYLLILAISGHTLSKDESDDKLLKNFKLFSLCVFIVNAVFSQLATVMENSWRMVILFGLFNVLTFSFIYQNENNRSKKLLLLFILLIYGCFYWYFVYVLTGRHGTVPYISA